MLTSNGLPDLDLESQTAQRSEVILLMPRDSWSGRGRESQPATHEAAVRRRHPLPCTHEGRAYLDLD